MATSTKNQRPDPLKDQQDALNRAVGAGAIGKNAPNLSRSADAASLDTFNAAPAPTKAEERPKDLKANQDDEGLRHPGGQEGTDSDGTHNLSPDQSAHAEEVAREHMSDLGQDHEDTDGEADESPFDFENPAIESLKQEMYDSLIVDEDRSMGGGTAAGRHAPGSSGGGGEVSSTGTQGGSGGGESSAISAGGSGGHQDAHDPFTGQGIGTNAYSEGGGIPALPDINSHLGGFKPDAQMTALMGMATAEASDHGNATPSVADGALNAAYKAVYAEQGKTDPDSGKTTSAAVIHKGEAGKPGSNAWYWDDDKGEVVEAKDVSDQAKAAAAADMKTTATTDTSKIEGAEAKSGDNLFNFIANHMDADDDYTKEMTKKAAEAQAAAQKRDAEKANQPEHKAKDALPPGSDDAGGPPTPEEIAFRAYLRQATNYHGSPGHNEGVTNPDPTSDGVDRSGTVSIDHSRDVQESMVGQPVRDGDGASGRGPLTLGRLPGDLGNVDPGEGDDFGPNTSNPQTDDPGSALDGFGGSGLSIADAHRDDEEDDDDSDDDDSN